jgi:CRP/FNR family cyclic AMP-dependent transcriptional regulator
MPMETDRSKARGGPDAADGQGKHEILRRSFFADLAPPSRDALLDLSQLERLPRRFPIAEQGEAPQRFVLLGSGRVKIERMRGERALSLGHRGPGQMVGETAVAAAGPATESASVVDEVEALVVPVAGLRKLLAADAPLRAAMACAIVQQHQSLEARLTALLLHGVEARLCAFLLDAVRRWGTSGPAHDGGELIAAPFTHAEIALLIGSTRETVTLLLGKLRRDGLIAFDRRRVVVRDEAALEQRIA